MTSKEERRKSLTEQLMNPQAMQKVLHDQATKLRSKWRKVVTGDEKKRIRDRLRETEAEPKYVKFFDKVAFTGGVLNICVCQYFLLNRADLFPAWYALIIPVILGSRYFYFKGSGLQYFMIDFCYFAIFCSMLNLLVIKTSPVFFKVCFVCCTGPLTLAIPVWRNSFVFHDFDKIVSVYIHILPAMLYYTTRHNSSRIGYSGSSDVCHPDNCSDLRVVDYIVALGLYSFWQFSYLLKTEFLDKAKLDNDPQLLTSLRWLAKDTKNATARMFLKLFRTVGVFRKDEEYDSTTLKTKSVFVFAQLLFTIVAFLPTPFMYYSSTFHLLYIIFIFATSVFNGASFYIEVFSKRYHSKIAKIEEMDRLARAAKNAISDLNTTIKESSSSKDGNQHAASTTPRRAAAATEGGALSTAGIAARVDASAAERPQVQPSEGSVEQESRETTENLTRLRAILQRTSDTAWREMKELVRSADEERGLYVERLSEEDVLAEGDVDLSPMSEDYVVCDASPDSVAGRKGLAEGAVSEGHDGDDEGGAAESELSPVVRTRNNSVLSIDK